jgi:hypothetical protein
LLASVACWPEGNGGCRPVDAFEDRLIAARRNAMHTSITKADIRELLAVFIAAIELDQVQVDALPETAFHEHYSDSMWRSWRRCHLQYASLLRSTVETVRPPTLEKLAWIAANYEPNIVRERAIDLLGYAASGSIVGEEVGTAALFFDLLIEEVSSRSGPTMFGQDARAMMMEWLTVKDPLQIAEDPECGYKKYLGVYAAS